jgi:hypothetical protein
VAAATRRAARRGNVIEAIIVFGLAPLASHHHIRSAGRRTAEHTSRVTAGEISVVNYTLAITSSRNRYNVDQN